MIRITLVLIIFIINVLYSETLATLFNDITESWQIDLVQNVKLITSNYDDIAVVLLGNDNENFRELFYDDIITDRDAILITTSLNLDQTEGRIFFGSKIVILLTETIDKVNIQI